MHKQRCIIFQIIISVILFSACSSTSKFERYEDVSGKLIESGEASWYGPNFHGRQTANGEIFDQNELTAAHRTLSFNSIVKVVNKSNGKSVIVRINDRGPYAKNRIIDLSKEAAEKINMINSGYAEVDLILLNNSNLPINLKAPHYTVQIGSFKSVHDASRLSSNFSDAKIVDTFIADEKYYRVYVGLYKNRIEAQNRKKDLQKLGIDGFVKQYGN